MAFGEQARGDNARELRSFLELLAPQFLRGSAHLGLQMGLGSRELTVLGELVAGGPATISELTAELSIPPSSMTAVVDRLEVRNLVERRPLPRDRRSVALVATAKAMEVLKSWEPVSHGWLDQALQALSDQEQATLVALLRRIRQARSAAAPRSAPTP